MKNLAGVERWIVLKEIPRVQVDNPKLSDQTEDLQHNLRIGRMRNEKVLFTTDEVLIKGKDEFSKFIFSADNEDKYLCKVGPELNYFIEQNYVRKLPYKREEIDILKENWLKDPVFDLYNFSGADEYWDELEKFQKEQEKIWRDSNAAIEKIAKVVASLPVFSPAGINFECFIIAMIAARVEEPKVCIEQAKGIIFEIAREQYNLQKKESKKDERKLGPRKSASGNS